MITIESSRLVIKSYAKGDESSIIDMLMSNKERLKPILSDWVYEIKNENDAFEFIKKMNIGEISKTIFALGIWLKSEKRLIGEIVFFKIDWINGKMEIGSYIDYRYQRMGLTTEAKRECLKYFFEKYPIVRLEAWCDLNNIAIHQVLLKCGFVKEEIIQDKKLILFSLYR